MANKTYKYIRRNQNPIDHHLYNDAEYTLLEFGDDSKGHRKSIVVVDEDGSVYDIYNWMEEIRGDKKEEKRLKDAGVLDNQFEMWAMMQFEAVYELVDEKSKRYQHYKTDIELNPNGIIKENK